MDSSMWVTIFFVGIIVIVAFVQWMINKKKSKARVISKTEKRKVGFDTDVIAHGNGVSIHGNATNSVFVGTESAQLPGDPTTDAPPPSLQKDDEE